MDGRFVELLGIFVGGAMPWLEAIVVIPVGIAAGLPPAAVVVFGATGNLLTVAIAAFFGERVRQWWRARRGDQGRPPVGTTGSRRSRWIASVFERWGLLGLAVLGPIGLGTQLSAVVAVAFGHTAKRTFAWIGTGTALWCITVGVLAGLGLQGGAIGSR